MSSNRGICRWILDRNHQIDYELLILGNSQCTKWLSMVVKVMLDRNALKFKFPIHSAWPILLLLGICVAYHSGVGLPLDARLNTYLYTSTYTCSLHRRTRRQVDMYIVMGLLKTPCSTPTASWRFCPSETRQARCGYQPWGWSHSTSTLRLLIRKADKQGTHWIQSILFNGCSAGKKCWDCRKSLTAVYGLPPIWFVFESVTVHCHQPYSRCFLKR